MVRLQLLPVGCTLLVGLLCGGCAQHGGGLNLLESWLHPEAALDDWHDPGLAMRHGGIAPLAGPRSYAAYPMPGRSAPDELLAAARKLEQQGQTREAEAMYRDIARKHPGHPGAWHRLGVLAAVDGRYDDANGLLQKASRIGRPSADLLSDIGYCYLLQDRLDDSEKALRQALAADPQHGAARSNLALLRQKRPQHEDLVADDSAELHASTSKRQSHDARLFLPRLRDEAEPPQTTDRIVAPQPPVTRPAAAVKQASRDEPQSRPSAKRDADEPRRSLGEPERFELAGDEAARSVAEADEKILRLQKALAAALADKWRIEAERDLIRSADFTRDETAREANATVYETQDRNAVSEDNPENANDDATPALPLIDNGEAAEAGATGGGGPSLSPSSREPSAKPGWRAKDEGVRQLSFIEDDLTGQHGQRRVKLSSQVEPDVPRQSRLQFTPPSIENSVPARHRYRVGRKGQYY